MFIEQYVAWFQIAMQDAALVRVLYSPSNFGKKCAGLAGRLPQLGYSPVQVASLDEFHAEELLSLMSADFVDGHDTRVIEPGGRLGLDVEPLHVGLGSELPGKNHLERHQPLELRMSGLEDHPHSAARQLREYLVFSQPL